MRVNRYIKAEQHGLESFSDIPTRKGQPSILLCHHSCEGFDDGYFNAVHFLSLSIHDSVIVFKLYFFFIFSYALSFSMQMLDNFTTLSKLLLPHLLRET